MTLTNIATSNRAADDTASLLRPGKTATFLLALSMAYAHASAPTMTLQHQTNDVHSSNRVTVVETEREQLIQVALALNSVYDRLVESCHSLDQESESILYNNLWDLYQA